MSLSQTERETRDVSMFGMSSVDLQDKVEGSMYRLTPLSDVHSDVMLVMSMLSDAQECIARSDDETARQYINRAKFILHYFVLNNE